MNSYPNFLRALLAIIYFFGFVGLIHAQTASIMGRVLDDDNSNCSIDINERGLGKVLVTARSLQNTYHTFSDSNGFYTFNLLPPDTYAVSANLAYDTLYWAACPDAFPVVTVQNGQIDTSNLLFAAIVEEALIRAELSSSRLEPCQTGTITLAMQNVGTDTSGAYTATLILDPNLSYAGTVVSSSAVVVSVLSPDTLLLFFNNSAAHELQTPLLYHFRVNLACDAIPNQLLFNKVFIDNDTSLARRPVWNDAIIKTSSRCAIDTVHFELKNIGNANQNPIEYYIVEDNVMLRQGTVNLQNNQSTTVSIPSASGHSYRLEAKNPIGIPAVLGDTFTYAMSERCDTALGLNSVMNWFPTNDVSPFVDYSATEILTSTPDFYIETSPKGYDTAHHVNQGAWIEYIIHFRNTQGNFVTDIDLIDTLPNELDISTLQVGASSHNIDFNIQDRVFNAHISNILLQDSNSNYTQSLGFITYRVRLKDNLPNGTVIRNRAHILFDINFAYYHLPEVFHTVGQNFIRVLSVYRNRLVNQKVNVFPNPFQTQTTFEVSGKAANLRLYVFNSLGQLVKMVQAEETNQLILNREQLNAGVYYYQLLANNLVLDAGKIVAE